MKNALILILACFMVITGCRTLNPIKQDDVAITIDISRSFVRAHASNDYFTTNIVEGTPGLNSIPAASETAVLIVAAFSIGWLADIGEFAFQGCDIYTYPAGHKDTNYYQ